MSQCKLVTILVFFITLFLGYGQEEINPYNSEPLMNQLRKEKCKKPTKMQIMFEIKVLSI